MKRRTFYLALGMLLCIAPLAGAKVLYQELLHYSFDSADITGTTVRDLSGNNHDGTNYNATPVTTGAPFGEALLFDAAGEYVSVGKPLLSQADASQPYTIAAWVKSADGTGGGLVTQYQGTPYGDRFGVRTDGGVPQWWHGDAQYIVAGSTNVNSDQQWHHVVFTRDASSDVRVYVDGVDETPAGTHIDAHTFTDAATEIGRFRAGTVDDFDGAIDEVWIYDRALARHEVRNLQQFNTLQPTILHYSFDTADLGGTGSGATVTDLSPQGNHGTINGSGISALTTGAPFGEALSFSGGSAVSVGKALLSATDPSQPYTIAFWVRSDAGAGTFTQYNTSDPDRFGIRTDLFGGKPTWWSGGAGGAGGNVSDLVASTTDAADGEWHHVVFVKDPWQNLSVYVDGTDETPPGTWTHPDDFANRITQIGRFTSTILPLTGDMDEVWVFAYALEPWQITNLYELNSTVPEPATLTLLGLGLLGLRPLARRRKR